MLAIRRDRRNRGFTLIEIMVAITLLTIILAIVYGSFSSVVMGIERTRAASERLKTTAFIERGFTQNLTQATEGWLPGAAYRPYSAPAAGGEQATSPAQGVEPGVLRLPFKGNLERGVGGSTDALTFASTAPMLGGGMLPGQIKLCSYRVEKEEKDEDVADEAAAASEEEEPRTLLVLTETPWTESGAGTSQELLGARSGRQNLDRAFNTLDDAAAAQPVTRSVPILGWDLAYYDGKKWVEEWDSGETGRMPWSVRVRVKLERGEDEEYASGGELDPEKDPGVLELFFDVPAGVGIHDAPPDYVRPGSREEQP